MTWSFVFTILLLVFSPVVLGSQCDVQNPLEKLLSENAPDPSLVTKIFSGDIERLSAADVVANLGRSQSADKEVLETFGFHPMKRKDGHPERIGPSSSMFYENSQGRNFLVKYGADGGLQGHKSNITYLLKSSPRTITLPGIEEALAQFGFTKHSQNTFQLRYRNANHTTELVFPKDMDNVRLSKAQEQELHELLTGKRSGIFRYETTTGKILRHMTNRNGATFTDIRTMFNQKDLVHGLGPYGFTLRSTSQHDQYTLIQVFRHEDGREIIANIKKQTTLGPKEEDAIANVLLGYSRKYHDESIPQDFKLLEHSRREAITKTEEEALTDFAVMARFLDLRYGNDMGNASDVVRASEKARIEKSADEMFEEAGFRQVPSEDVAKVYRHDNGSSIAVPEGVDVGLYFSELSRSQAVELTALLERKKVGTIVLVNKGEVAAPAGTALVPVGQESIAEKMVDAIIVTREATILEREGFIRLPKTDIYRHPSGREIHFRDLKTKLTPRQQADFEAVLYGRREGTFFFESSDEVFTDSLEDFFQVRNADTPANENILEILGFEKVRDKNTLDVTYRRGDSLIVFPRSSGYGWSDGQLTEIEAILSGKKTGVFRYSPPGKISNSLSRMLRWRKAEVEVVKLGRGLDDEVMAYFGFTRTRTSQHSKSYKNSSGSEVVLPTERNEYLWDDYMETRYHRNAEFKKLLRILEGKEVGTFRHKRAFEETTIVPESFTHLKETIPDFNGEALTLFPYQYVNELPLGTIYYDIQGTRYVRGVNFPKEEIKVGVRPEYLSAPQREKIPAVKLTHDFDTYRNLGYEQRNFGKFTVWTHPRGGRIMYPTTTNMVPESTSVTQALGDFTSKYTHPELANTGKAWDTLRSAPTGTAVDLASELKSLGLAEISKPRDGIVKLGFLDSSDRAVYLPEGAGKTKLTEREIKHLDEFLKGQRRTFATEDIQEKSIDFILRNINDLNAQGFTVALDHLSLKYSTHHHNRVNKAFISISTGGDYLVHITFPMDMVPGQFSARAMDEIRKVLREGKGRLTFGTRTSDDFKY